MPPRPAAADQPELRRAPGWRRFLAPYYTSTLAVLPIYGLARHWFDETGGSAYSRVGSSEELWEKVRSMGACMAALGAAGACGGWAVCERCMPQVGMVVGWRRVPTIASRVSPAFLHRLLRLLVAPLLPLGRSG